MGILPSAVIGVVESDSAIAGALATLLEIYGIDVNAFPSGERFLDAIQTAQDTYRCVLICAELAGQDGVKLTRNLRQSGFRHPIIVLTDGGRAVRQRALDAGADEVMEKPLVTAFLFRRLTELMPDSMLAGQTPQALALPNGTEVTFRVMQPEDAGIEQAFIAALSQRSKYLRFFSHIRELAPDMLETFTHPNYPESYALIATIRDDGCERQIGVARYAPTTARGIAEFAVVIADDWQGYGIASRLLRGLTVAAAIGGIERLEGLVLKQNPKMLALSRFLGFEVCPADDPTIVRVTKDLGRHSR